MFVSVALCTYNGKKYIESQLESIILQTRPVDEIVIVDDHSTDHTLEAAEKFLHKQKVSFRLVRNDTNLGVTKNFEKAIGLCKGDIIFTCDQDDLWKIDKVEKMIKPFEDSNVNMVFTNANLIDGKSKSLNKKLFDTLEIYPSQEKLADHLLKVTQVTGACMAIRKSLYEACLPFNDQWIHDEWLAINAIMMGKVVVLEECLTKYRIHENNVIGIEEVNKKEKYKANIAKGKELREYKSKRYHLVLEHLKNKEVNENYTKLEACCKFYDSITDHASFTSMTRNLVNGNYKKFASGLPAYIRDIQSK